MLVPAGAAEFSSEQAGQFGVTQNDALTVVVDLVAQRFLARESLHERLGVVEILMLFGVKTHDQVMLGLDMPFRQVIAEQSVEVDIERDPNLDLLDLARLPGRWAELEMTYQFGQRLLGYPGDRKNEEVARSHLLSHADYLLAQQRLLWVAITGQHHEGVFGSSLQDARLPRYSKRDHLSVVWTMADGLDLTPAPAMGKHHVFGGHFVDPTQPEGSAHWRTGNLTALDVMYLGALVDDDQGPLELPRVFGVDPEVRLERQRHLDTLGHVDEAVVGHDVVRHEVLVALDLDVVDLRGLAGVLDFLHRGEADLPEAAGGRAAAVVGHQLVVGVRVDHGDEVALGQAAHRQPALRPGWQAVDPGLGLAQRQEAVVRGAHDLVPGDLQAHDALDAVVDLGEHFRQRGAAFELGGEDPVAHGDVGDRDAAALAEQDRVGGEAAAGPDGGVERGELVVLQGDDGGEVLLEQLGVFLERLVGAHEDHADLGELLADAVVDDLGVVDEQPLGHEIMGAVHHEVVGLRLPVGLYR